MKALIAMSGGVDSSVAAQIMSSRGYECVGCTMRLYENDTVGMDLLDTCCSLENTQDARSVTERIGIPYHIVHYENLFREEVIEPFIDEYLHGHTPNPCIECNRHLKFDHFLRKALVLGCDYIVTGHYARIRYDEATGRYLLLKAADVTKDQSYVLYCLTQEQLSHTLFPLGEMTKSDVRAIAEEKGFINARKHDSQDICFVPDGDYFAFMERYTGKKYESGNFLDLDGNVVGKHRSAVAYTLGQRKGLGLAMGAPVYVCGKNMEANTVTVGPNEALYATTLRANNWNWFPFPALTEPMRVTARSRYNQKERPATVYPEENGFARVVFDEPQRAMTPGQAVVLYDGDLVVGGGTIREVIK